MSNNYLIAGTDPLQLIDYCLGELAKFSQGMLSRLSERSFIIVPEALKADIERRYLENYDVNGLMLAEVLSFNRLAHRIFSIAGGLSRDSISTLGKTLIIQRLIYEHGDQFKRFQRFAGKPGYTKELETILSDFKRFDFDNQSLRELVELTPPSLTKDKLSDFAELQKLYTDKLEELNLLDQDDNLDYLADLLERAIIDKESASSASSGDDLNQDLHFLSETRIWITGFADIRSFTQQELKIIKLLSQTVKELKITVCTDLSSQGRLRRELFEPGYRSYIQLVELLPAAELIVLPSKISDIQRDLQNSFITGSLAKNSEEQEVRRIENIHEKLESPQITLLAADDRRQEWFFIAGEIKRLLQEENIRKKDIGIAICDNVQDLSLEKSTFREFALDVFLSERLPTRQTPLYRYLAGFFNLANQNFSLAELIAFFRSGLAEPTQDEIDTFENICLEYGIKFASQIQSDKAYQRIQDDEAKTAALNFKNAYLSPILSSSKKLSSLRHGKEKAQFLLQWLARDSFKNNLQAKITDLRHWGEEDMALSLARSWEIVLQLLEESMALLADSRINQKGFSEIILGALSGQIPSSIPVGLDRIRVGTMREMMYYDCKILFIAGTSQNTFPPAKFSEGFLHNRELEWIEAKSGKSLPDYRKNQLMAGQVSSMLLLSGAKEKIYLTTPYIDKAEWSSVFMLLRKELQEKTDFARQANLNSFILGDKLQPDQRWLTRQRTQRYLKASLQAKKNLKDQKANRTEYLSLLDPKKQKDYLPQSKTYWYQAINNLLEGENLLESNGKFLLLEDEFQDPLDQIKPYIYLDKILNSNVLSNKQYVS
ncbi:MAG TPA: hypothetical protein VFD28_04305, partial [Candidatus Eisenbacteria bacterium]|nr:hypothetical protein [Candidatus Eisenbacteria bacterium]